MARSCGCCNHDNRLGLDRDVCGGLSYTKIARKYGVSRDSVAYHAENHLSHQLVTAIGKKAALENLDLLGEIEDLLQRTKRILTEAEDKKKYNLALAAIREARGVYELLSKIAFSLHQVRLTELELERERSGEAERERQEAYDGRLAVLSDSELDLFERLCLKIQNQDRHTVISPDSPKTVFSKPSRKTPPDNDDLDLEPELEEEEEPEGPEPVEDEEPTMRRTKPPKRKHKVRPVESVEIPGGGRGRYDDNIKRRKLLRRVGTRRTDTGGGPLSGVAIPIPEE